MGMIIEDKIKLTLDRIYDAALKAANPVSYTHLTLPTPPYV